MAILTILQSKFKNLNFSIKKLIEKYFEPEYIEDYKCSGCYQKVKIRKRTFIWEFPKVMFVFFKRFEFHHGSQKLRGKIKIPKGRVELAEFCPNNDCNFFN